MKAGPARPIHPSPNSLASFLHLYNPVHEGGGEIINKINFFYSRCTLKVLLSKQEEAQTQHPENSAINPARREGLSLLADRTKQGRELA